MEKLSEIKRLVNFKIFFFFHISVLLSSSFTHLTQVLYGEKKL